jgi:hypothetical protein
MFVLEHSEMTIYKKEKKKKKNLKSMTKEGLKEKGFMKKENKDKEGGERNDMSDNESTWYNGRRDMRRWVSTTPVAPFLVMFVLEYQDDFCWYTSSSL